ncbi:GNAT family N-acetyltransferase [Streptomyces sp. NPDC048507]|uniref:GNAT family N-acetyltransferase n=1 Tax=Streptomyces sp. NPDC048507 TaxID=3365560 RepID=UPI00371DBADE
MTEIRTPRLILRRWSDDDLVPLSEIHADPEVMRWIGDGGALDLDGTAEAIERWEEEWDDEGFGVFAVELLASGELIGAVGLTVPDGPPEVEHGVAAVWRLGRPFWGQGYASEAAHATLEFALQDRGLDRVVAVNRSGNDESENVIRKLGMKQDGNTTDPDSGALLTLYSIDLTEYEA